MMKSEEKADALKAKHRELEDAIDEENKHPNPDGIQITALKKQKLRIKDALAELTAP